MKAKRPEAGPASAPTNIRKMVFFCERTHCWERGERGCSKIACVGLGIRYYFGDVTVQGAGFTPDWHRVGSFRV